MIRVQPDESPVDPTTRRFPRTAAEAFKDEEYTRREHPLDGWPYEQPSPFERFEDTFDWLERNLFPWSLRIVVAIVAASAIAAWLR